MTSQQLQKPAQQAMLDTINEQLKKAREEGYHVLAPITLQTIPPMHRPVVAMVQINPDPKLKEVYPQKGGGLSLSALAFKKLGDAIGIQWLPQESGRVDDGRDPNYVHYRMVGLVKNLDGTWRRIFGDKEIRIETIIEELTDNYRAKAQQYLRDRSSAPADFKSVRTEEDAEAWVREKVRQDALQMKKHLLARAQSGAMARATKALGIRETYTAEELKKPFVFPKLVFEPDPNHPQDRAFLLAQGAGAIDQLYAPAQPTMQAQAPLVTLPPTDTESPTLLIHELPSEGETGDTDARMPSAAENARADFLAADPKQQASILKTLVRRKGYDLSKIKGDVEKWTAQDRLQFYDRLVAMPDQSAGAGPHPLPFE